MTWRADLAHPGPGTHGGPLDEGEQRAPASVIEARLDQLSLASSASRRVA